ncbi:MAG: pyridoxamine 5'-phosphate oxidase family protein [Paracoccaceae bacterium]|nr:pyridoxamine 5'-phosphate oxidase family protein [Paracoccaceae bacterium]
MPLEINAPITTHERLREAIPRRPGAANEKDIDHLNDVARDFIARSPFCIISTVGRDGLHDISPKGDPAGFVQVRDEKTLIIPDRVGNQRLDTFENIIDDPRVGLFFMIPGHRDTLRVSGTAVIAADEALRQPLAVNGRAPALVLVVTVEQAFMHCSKCVVRSKLWHPDSWTSAEGAPSVARWVKSTVNPAETLEEIEARHDIDRVERLY